VSHVAHGPIEPHTDFDYSALEGEAPEQAGRNYEAVALAVRRVIMWLLAGQEQSPDVHLIGKRTLALAFSLDRSLFNGSPSSRRLAKVACVSKSELGRQIVAARNEFGLNPSGQKGTQ